MSGENWRVIPGWEGSYEVSDLGRVRSTDRTVLCTRNGGQYTMPVKGRILKLNPNGADYPIVGLKRPGYRKSMTVYRAVLLAFVGPLPDGLVTRHLNGDRWDSRLTNLVYGTQSENIRDAVAQGTQANARKTHCSRGGHELAGWNLIVQRGGNRTCRTCSYELARARRLRRKGRAA